MQKAENKSSKAIDNYINEIVKLVFTQYGVELEISEEVVEAFIQNKLQTYNQNGSEGLLKYLVLLNDHTHDAINKISDHLSKETIVIKNLNVFVDAANQHIDFLSSIFNKIVYEDCKFYTNQYSTSSKLEIALSAQDKIFEKCSFDVNIALITDFNDEEYNEYLFNNCEFSATVEIRRTRAEAAYKDEEMAVLSPYKAIFLNPKHIKNLVVERIYGALCLFGAQGNLTKVQKLEIKNCEFTKEFELRANVESLKILNTQFNHFANFDNCVFEEISCKQTKFKEATSFKECVFGKENSESGTAIFDSVGFFGKANFYKSVFNSPLELSSAEFFQQPSFLYTQFIAAGKSKTARETFRLIKHSFNAVGNNIEASRFFALEMEAYKRELKESKATKAERFLVTFNSCISNHGQSYRKAALWWLGTIAMIGVVLANAQNQWLATNFEGSTTWQFVRNALNIIANGFLPLKPIYASYKGYEAFIFISSMFLSAVTWHLLVALRRHSKK